MPETLHPLAPDTATSPAVNGYAHAQINGHRLRYRVRGEGPLAVFGHGLLGSIEQLDDHVSAHDALEARLRLLFYDARGHGQSEGPPEPAHYTWATLGEDMAAFAAHAGEPRAIFGGGSMGAATALWVALERPELVRALVLVMPPPLGHAHMRGDDEHRALQGLEVIAAAVQNFGLEQTIALARQLPAASEAEAEERVRWLEGQNPLALRCAVRGLLQSPFHDPEAYRAIRVPTLVIAHEGDGLHPVRAARLVAANVPGARLAVAPDPAYWRAHPDEFAAEVLAFLDGLGA